MAHGYLGDGYGKDGWRDPDGGSDDDRGRRGEWRGEQRGQRYDRNDSDRERGRFMFEGGSGDREQERGDHRGFFSRTADEARDWFDKDEHDYRPRGEDRYSRQQQPSNQHSAFSSGQHDHYLKWRQQQIDALDRDYQDYCQERQQQFHSDFDSWRSNRQSRQSESSQQANQQRPGKKDKELELSERDEIAGTTSARNAPTATVSPVGDATLGTNNPENSVTGRS